ncbi:MAG TPA: hypothetical protein VFB55_08770 [Verrucomicrobiae bacterium]|nr:hypothetical protein [Verrucomicrobiae bacterium]
MRPGASTAACQHIIPPVLREFKESFPEHAISIEPNDTRGERLNLAEETFIGLCELATGLFQGSKL